MRKMQYHYVEIIILYDKRIVGRLFVSAEALFISDSITYSI